MSHSAETTAHGSVKSYLVGFVLSVILTGIPFWMVMSGHFGKSVLFYSGFLCDSANSGALEILLALGFFGQGANGHFCISFYRADYCDGGWVVHLDHL